MKNEEKTYFKKNKKNKKISVSLDKNLNELLEKDDINKSKFINFLIKDFFENSENEENIKKFQKK